MKIITVASLKGGVGKTTIAANLALHLSARRKRVLIVDLDPQASATDFFLRSISVEDIEAAGAYQVLTERMEPGEAVRQNGEVHVLPASLRLHTVGAEMTGDPGAIFRAARSFGSLRHYDYVVIDTPPSLSYEFRVGLYAANMILSPVTFDRWALQGLALLALELGKAKKAGHEPTLKIVPSIVTQNEAEKLRSEVGKKYPVTSAAVTRSAAIRMALSKGQPLKETLRAAEEFRDLAEELK